MAGNSNKGIKTFLNIVEKYLCKSFRSRKYSL